MMGLWLSGITSLRTLLSMLLIREAKGSRAASDVPEAEDEEDEDEDPSRPAEESDVEARASVCSDVLSVAC